MCQVASDIPHRRARQRPPAQEKFVGQRIVFVPDVRMAWLSAPEMRRLGCDARRQELSELPRFAGPSHADAWTRGDGRDDPRNAWVSRRDGNSRPAVDQDLRVGHLEPGVMIGCGLRLNGGGGGGGGGARALGARQEGTWEY